MLARAPYRKPVLRRPVTINAEQRLYVIPCGDKGFTCLGFDVAERWTAGYVAFVRSCGAEPSFPSAWESGVPVPYTWSPGTLEAYQAHVIAERAAALAHAVTGRRCEMHLIDTLRPFEGRRVEVVDRDGNRRRFIVGRSMGWAPCHLEIATRRSLGGTPADSRGYASVEIVTERTRR